MEIMTEVAMAWGLAEPPELDPATELDRLAASLEAISQTFCKDEKRQGGKLQGGRRQRGVINQRHAGRRQSPRLRTAEHEAA
jgi:hypothetical protein